MRVIVALITAVVMAMLLPHGMADSNEQEVLLRELHELENLTIAPTTTVELAGSQKVISACNDTNKVEWMTDWAPSERIKQWFPIYRLGVDADGAAVYLDLYGRFNFKALVDDGTEEDRKNLDEYFDYVDTKAACDSAANNGGDGIVVILDWDGFSVSSYGSLSVSHLVIKKLGRLGKLQNAIKQTYSINTSYAVEVFLNAARAELGKLVENFQVYGTQREKWMPRLLQAIPPHLLPRKYGGTNDDVRI